MDLQGFVGLIQVFCRRRFNGLTGSMHEGLIGFDLALLGLQLPIVGNVRKAPSKAVECWRKEQTNKSPRDAE